MMFFGGVVLGIFLVAPITFVIGLTIGLERGLARRRVLTLAPRLRRPR
jgi:hypothetical protein